jgi:hypothetical protein
MAPRPFEIFQKSSPSDSFFTVFDVQLAGFGFSATAAGPSPLPFSPWQDAQLVLMDFSPSSCPFSGFLAFFASAGAFHSPCAHTVPTLDAAISAAPAATSASDFSLPMGPPLFVRA